MNAALLRKELRDQAAFLGLGAMLCAVEIADALFSQIDMHSLAHRVTGESGFLSALQLVLAFAIGTGLLVREQDDGTLRFLDGLPVTRLRLFAGKLVVALAVLMLYPTLRLALGALLHLASHSSLTEAMHPSLLAWTWGLTALLTFIGLSAGLLFGFLRSLAWASFGAVAIAVRLLGEHVPRALALDPMELGTPRFVGLRCHVSTEALALQAGLAALMCAVAGLVFCGARGRRAARLGGALKGPILSALVAALTVGALFTALVLYSKDSKDKPDPKDKVAAAGAEFPAAKPARLATRHYEFRYSSFRASTVRALAEQADAAFAQVATILPEGRDSPIDVDLSGSMENTAGTAFWERVRMEPDTEHAVAVLAHETAHVLAHRLVGDRGADLLERMPVLSEGQAQWIAYGAPGGEALEQRDELAAAALYRRHEVSFAELVDYAEFERVRDQNLKYPLGAALVKALAARYGNGALRNVLAALAREDFPADRRGLELWQTAFQLAGYDLSAVVDVFFGELQAWAQQREGALAALPRLRAVLAPERSRVAIRVLADRALPSGARLAVRVRPTADSPLSEYATYSAEDGQALVERSRVAHDTLCLQPGLFYQGAMLYEPWSCQPVEWADDDE